MYKTPVFTLVDVGIHIMGYGGALIWTGMARNLHRQFPDKKIVFVYRFSLRRNPDLDIYHNNPDIALVVNHIWWKCVKLWYHRTGRIVIDLNDKRYHYWVNDTPERMSYRQDGHAINIACRPFDLPTIELKTRLVLTDQENTETENVLRKFNVLDKYYICVEPNAKKIFTANKQWPWEHWQQLIDQLSVWNTTHAKGYEIVQIGVHGSPVLNGVIDLTGSTTFRQLKNIIDRAVLVIANEGGIAHLCASSDTQAVIISNPSLPLKLMTYPQHINILPEIGPHNCGLKKPCAICHELLISISPTTVYEKSIVLLN